MDFRRMNLSRYFFEILGFSATRGDFKLLVTSVAYKQISRMLQQCLLLT